MPDQVLPDTEPTGAPLAYADLRRGMLVEWRWSPGMADMASRTGVRPIGRVITREDMPTMDEGEGPLGIQALDAAWWVVGPRAFLAKGGRLWTAAEGQPLRL